MNDQDKREFSDLLKATFDAYSRPLPLPETQVIWWRLCQPHPMEAVRSAFGRYIATEPRFPPTPAQILEMMGQGRGDNRPGSDEAWATALRSRDEAATIVWTAEAAQAFAICRSVLEAGDEVGARMAFRQAYDRLVSEARAVGRPPLWQASLGWDSAKREKVLLEAVEAGVLPAPTAAALLPAPATSDGPTEVGTAQLATIREMVASLGSPLDRIIDQRMEANAAQRERLNEAKRRAAEAVRQRSES